MHWVNWRFKHLIHRLFVHLFSVFVHTWLMIFWMVGCSGPATFLQFSKKDKTNKMETISHHFRKEIDCNEKKKKKMQLTGLYSSFGPIVLSLSWFCIICARCIWSWWCRCICISSLWWFWKVSIFDRNLIICFNFRRKKSHLHCVHGLNGLRVDVLFSDREGERFHELVPSNSKRTFDYHRIQTIEQPN